MLCFFIVRGSAACLQLGSAAQAKPLDDCSSSQFHGSLMRDPEPESHRDQALSLWRGSTHSKTLGNQRANVRECHIERTHTKETT